MQTDVSWSDLHDATLEYLRLSWSTGEILVRLRTGIWSCPEVTVRGHAGQRVECPRQHPWGASVSVNEVRAPVEEAQGSVRLEIEMQSGDLLVLVAERFELVCEASVVT